ncbi:MAG: DUF3048 domain-containing protein [Lachnospiraceae bacterium]|nr:DUF3048 domain-containing protein [Lachnospiraceae bacterium]MCI9134120.1 DUF3048 domain-containing protein [Lachnospiraceae bacterium]
MKKRMQKLCLLLALGVVLAGCGKKEEAVETVEPSTQEESFNTEEEVVDSEPEAEAPPVEEESREGMFRSEITNEWIDESLWGQRPIAVMVDNEKTALPHFGLTQADVVYEMMNSTANDRITRFMCIVKDWNSLTQFGSIRSVRPTNLQIAPEWNAVVCHDGGPHYIEAYLKNPYVEHFSGTFSRVNNGKPREFTEYILPGDMDKNFNRTGFSTTYNEYYQGPHFTFATEANPVDLSAASDAIDCTFIDLPFKHNGSELKYDEASGTYLYSEYGSPHLDPENGDKQLAFKNVLLQDMRFQQYDSNGYMGFYCIDSGRDGYYITNGKAIPVTWTKESDLGITRFYDKDGNEITVNTGKTYIGIVPDDNWSELVLQ